jgi:hypothetical protein
VGSGQIAWVLAAWSAATHCGQVSDATALPGIGVIDSDRAYIKRWINSQLPALLARGAILLMTQVNFLRCMKTAGSKNNTKCLHGITSRAGFMLFENGGFELVSLE